MSKSPSLQVDQLLGDSPPYIELSNQIRLMIANGYLDSEDTLPSVRDIAEKITISPNTVSRAYQLLAEEGLVRKTWLGYVVVGPKEISEIRKHRIKKAVREFRKDLLAQGYSHEEITASFKENRA